MSTDTQARIAALLDTTARLAARIAVECNAFEARRPQEVAPGMAETQRLANLYRHECAALRRDLAGLQATAAPLKLRLKTATEQLDALLQRHARAVEAARSLTEGLVRAIAEEVAAARPTGAGYGPARKPADPRSVALNARA